MARVIVLQQKPRVASARLWRGDRHQLQAKATPDLTKAATPSKASQHPKPMSRHQQMGHSDEKDAVPVRHDIRCVKTKLKLRDVASRKGRGGIGEVLCEVYTVKRAADIEFLGFYPA